MADDRDIGATLCDLCIPSTLSLSLDVVNTFLDR